jgi:two-component system NtrC family sensor kinase
MPGSASRAIPGGSEDKVVPVTPPRVGDGPGEETGVASRWRIRHKLMLGLALVVATMVLLLGGTVRGLWSYYLDMNSLRAKTSQLRLAEDVKAAVSYITRFAERPPIVGEETPVERKRSDADAETPGRPKLPPLPGEENNDPLPHRHKPANLSEALDLAGRTLDEYELSLSEGGGHEVHSPSDDDALARIQSLREEFTTLKRNLDEKEKSKESIEGIFVPASGDEKIDVAERGKRAKQMAKIELIAYDLCSCIHREMQDRINNSRRNYQVTAWIAGLASIVGLLLVCGLFGSFYAWVFHPIRDLEAGVGRVAKGDFNHRIEVHSGDEMEDLGAAFNDMMQRLQDLYSDLERQVNERSRQLVRSERLASVGFLAAGVAHEINNPLASIAFCSEALEARLGDLLRQQRATARSNEEQEIFSKYLKMIQEEAFRCKNITERLLAFSRPGERRREKTDLRELVQMVLDVTQHLPNHRGKEIAFELNADRLAGGSIAA